MNKLRRDNSALASAVKANDNIKIFQSNIDKMLMMDMGFDERESVTQITR
jgi:hypothetical protein